MVNSEKKIGLMGGTFDPVHNGHLHLAKEAQKFLDLDRVLFIPAFRSPHKLELEPETCEHRVSMLGLALENQPGFFMDKIEINKQAVSYTIETLEELKADHPDWNMFLILGADAFLAIDTWKDCTKLLDFCNILVGTRPGAAFEIPKSIKNKLSLSEPEKISNSLKKETESKVLENQKNGTQVIFFKIPLLDISSKDIRQRILRKEEIKNLLPPSVDHYIMKHRLYRDDPPPKVA